MNKDRRKDIDNVMADLEKLREALDTVKSGFGDIVERIGTIRDEEQDYLDAMPEAFQQGERGQDAEHAIDQLGLALDACEELACLSVDIDDIITALDEAKAA